MTPPTVAPARPEVVTRAVPVSRYAWIERATSTDHKSVGLLYIATALVFLAIAITEFVLMRIQLIVPENTLIHAEIFDRLLTASGVTAIVLFAIPLAAGLITCVVPLQIGARSVAFPRLGLLSYWLYLAGAVAVYASFLYTPPDTGLAALPPLSDATFAPSNAVDAWITGVGLATLGFVVFAVNMVVTLQRMRAPGVAWRRMPLFAWAGTVISYLLLIVGPVMVAALVMLFIDRNFDGVFFDPGEGGAPLLYQHLSYIFFTGGWLVVVLAAAGVISEILPTFARKPIFSHRAAAGSLIAIAVLGLLAWMQNMYAAPINEGWTIMAMAFALALVVPIGLLFFNWIATVWRGTLRLTAAAWYALAALSTMAFGLTGELAYSVIPVGWQLDATTTSQADTLYVLVGGAVIGGFAALHYWFPKLSGRLLGEGVGKIALALIVAGIHLYALMMVLAGLEGQPVDIYEYFEGTGVSTYNLIASIGAFVLAAGVLLELGNAAYSWGNGIAARGHDPWGGATLEWFALSPPPPHNFDAVPDVRSTEPLHDIRDAVARATDTWQAPAPLERVEPATAAPVAAAPEPAAQGPGGEAEVPDDADGPPVA